MSPARLIATIALCAFIIDRLIASLMFVSSYLEVSRDKSRKGQAKRQELSRKFLYFVLSGSLGLVVILAFRDLRLDLSAFKSLPAYSSDVLTWLVLVAGADRVSAFIGVGSDAAPASEPVESVEIRVAGTLRVDPETAAKISEQTEVR